MIFRAIVIRPIDRASLQNRDGACGVFVGLGSKPITTREAL